MKFVSIFAAFVALVLLPACSAFAPLSMADIDDENRRCQGIGLGFQSSAERRSYIVEMESRGYLNSADISAINRQRAQL